MTSAAPTLGVLIVEDDPQIARLHWAFVEAAGGFTVLGQAESLAVARAMIRTLRPDVLLLDVQLPDGRGLELLRELRASELSGQAAADDGPGPVEVVLVTAASDSASIGQALNLGAADYLVKPSEPPRLALALSRARERRALTRRGRALEQSQVDALFGAPAAPPPPGLEPDTLARVRAAVQGAGARSAAEVGQALNLSRVTAWRYLEYLAGEGELEVLSGRPGEVSVGRPVKLYRRRPGGQGGR